MVMDGTEVKDDVTLSPEKPGTPNVETYTKDQVEKQVRDARSAALADVGRLRKTNEEVLARLDRMEQERQEAELEAVKDDPPELARIRTEQENRQLKAKLEKVDPELNEWRQEKATREKEKVAREVATRLTIDPGKLVELARFTDGTPEAIEAIAKELPKAKKPLKIDSGSMVGGMSTFEETRTAYIKDPRDPVIKARYEELRRGQKR